jgi:polysulfide reductase-like protein
VSDLQGPRDAGAGHPVQDDVAPRERPGGTAARTGYARGRPAAPQVVPRDEPRSYYGEPVINEPTWEWEIPWYLLAGGITGTAAPFAVAAELAGEDVLARRAWIVATAGVTVSPLLLIADLGRPERFLNMLRVFKPTSPMSMGTWILSTCAPAVVLSTARALLGWFPRLGTAATPVAAVLGPPLATYTAVLLADTAVPIWHEAGRELPWVFGASAAMSGAAAIAVITPAAQAAPAQRLAVGGAAAGLVASTVMERRLGELAEPYEHGAPSRLMKASKALMAAGAGAVVAGGRRRPALARAGAAVLTAAAAVERWGIFKAGFVSARDPKYIVGPQRRRLDARGGVPSRRDSR